jgi:hypothetical protein
MNKFQKSLDRIKKNLPFHDDKWSDEDKEHILTVTEALERQIPKEIRTEHITRELKRYYCPACNQHYYDISHKYCHFCGQALDWRDTK